MGDTGGGITAETNGIETPTDVGEIVEVLVQKVEEDLALLNVENSPKRELNATFHDVEVDKEVTQVSEDLKSSVVKQFENDRTNEDSKNDDSNHDIQQQSPHSEDRIESASEEALSEPESNEDVIDLIDSKRKNLQERSDKEAEKKDVFGSDHASSSSKSNDQTSRHERLLVAQSTIVSAAKEQSFDGEASIPTHGTSEPFVAKVAETSSQSGDKINPRRPDSPARTAMVRAQTTLLKEKLRKRRRLVFPAKHVTTLKATGFKSKVIERHMQANRVLRQQAERAERELEERIAEKKRQRETRETTAEQSDLRRQLEVAETEFNRIYRVVSELKSAERHLLNKLSTQLKLEGQSGNRLHSKSVELDQTVASVTDECESLRKSVQAQKEYFQSKEFKAKVDCHNQLATLSEELKSIKEENKLARETLSSMDCSRRGRMTEEVIHLRKLEETNMQLKRAIKNYEAVKHRYITPEEAKERNVQLFLTGSKQREICQALDFVAKDKKGVLSKLDSMNRTSHALSHQLATTEVDQERTLEELQESEREWQRREEVASVETQRAKSQVKALINQLRNAGAL